jgi:hypothetical protein
MCDRECLNIILENISKRASDIFKEKLDSIYLYEKEVWFICTRRL